LSKPIPYICVMKLELLLSLLFFGCFSLKSNGEDLQPQKSEGNSLYFLYNSYSTPVFNKDLNAKLFPMRENEYFGNSFGIYESLGTTANRWVEKMNTGVFSRYTIDFYFDSKGIHKLWSKFCLVLK